MPRERRRATERGHAGLNRFHLVSPRQNVFRIALAARDYNSPVSSKIKDEESMAPERRCSHTNESRPRIHPLCTALLLLAAASHPARAADEDRFRVLPAATAQGQSLSLPNAVSSAGDVVVGQVRTTEGFLAAVWKDGTLRTLGDFPGGDTLSSAKDVSDGTIVGVGQDASGTVAFFSTGQSLTALPPLAGARGPNREAEGISRDGRVIVGRSEGREIPSPSEPTKTLVLRLPVRWVDLAPQELATLGGSIPSGVAFATNRDGTVAAGTVGPVDSPTGIGTRVDQPVVWEEAAVVPLPIPSGSNCNGGAERAAPQSR
jgi:hypothetical protein